MWNFLLIILLFLFTIGLSAQELETKIETINPAQREASLQSELSTKQKYSCYAQQGSKQSFAICGNGHLIYDDVTGLMWTRCSIGKIWNDKHRSCEGKASIFNWKESLKQVGSFNQGNEHNDWRLPNIKELASIVDLSCIYPAINQSYFPDTDNADFWTSSVYEQYPGRAWFFSFSLGNDYASDKRYFKQIRLVRLGHANASYNHVIGSAANLENACKKYNPDKSTIVLIPDSDGHVGEVSISNENSSITLNQAHTTVDVKQSQNIASPSQISESETNQLFASALSAKPTAANNFILYFKTGKTILLPDSKKKLDQSIALIKQAKVVDVYISGHTDTQGENDINDKLALDRAERVAELIKKQLNTNQIHHITISSHGENDPIVITEDNVKEQKNRRVEVSLHL